MIESDMLIYNFINTHKPSSQCSVLFCLMDNNKK